MRRDRIIPRDHDENSVRVETPTGVTFHSKSFINVRNKTRPLPNVNDNRNYHTKGFNSTSSTRR